MFNFYFIQLFVFFGVDMNQRIANNKQTDLVKVKYKL